MSYAGLVTFIELPHQTPMPYLCVEETPDHLLLIALRSGIAAYRIRKVPRSEATIIFYYEDEGLIRATIKELEDLLQDEDLTFAPGYVDSAEFAVLALKKALATKIFPTMGQEEQVKPMESNETQWAAPKKGSLTGQLIGLQAGGQKRLYLCLAESDGLLSVVSPSVEGGGIVSHVRLGGKNGWKVYHSEPGLGHLEELVEALMDSTDAQFQANGEALAPRLFELTGPEPAVDHQITITFPPHLDKNKVVDIVQDVLNKHPYTRPKLPGV
ncbi:MAG: hypothetical protein KDA84_11065 [Planctomycetaceae bacterium]|nr:hypothetical protein [Planctomycetaceae bacterium]